MWLLGLAGQAAIVVVVYGVAVKRAREECSRVAGLSAMEQAVAETVDLGELVPAQRDGER